LTWCFAWWTERAQDRKENVNAPWEKKKSWPYGVPKTQTGRSRRKHAGWKDKCNTACKGRKNVTGNRTSRWGVEQKTLAEKHHHALSGKRRTEKRKERIDPQKLCQGGRRGRGGGHGLFRGGVHKGQIVSFVEKEMWKRENKEGASRLGGRKKKNKDSRGQRGTSVRSGRECCCQRKKKHLFKKRNVNG